MGKVCRGSAESGQWCDGWDHADLPYRRRGMLRHSAEAPSIIAPAATKTDDRLNTDSSSVHTTGGPSCATSRKLTNTVVISERSYGCTARRNSRLPAPSM